MEPQAVTLRHWRPLDHFEQREEDGQLSSGPRALGSRGGGPQGVQEEKLRVSDHVHGRIVRRC